MRFHLNDSKANFYSATVYGKNKQDALNNYRKQWYPTRQRLPKGIKIWESE